MKRKIMCILKNILCLLLICGMLVPSYASLSASDGSAFVTKGEFDSAINDFNARLTTFEAGINSKIDSQVTSYLDRNGIWSGKTQTIVTSQFSVPTPLSMGYGNSSKYATTRSSYNLACTTSAAGLFAVRVYYYSTLGNSSNAWWGYKRTSWDNYKNLFDDGLNINVVFTNRTRDFTTESMDPSDIKYSWNLYASGPTPADRVSGTWNADFLLKMGWPPEKTYQNIYFFVSNKEKIYYIFVADARSGFDKTEVTFNAGDGVIGIDDIKVY